MAIEIVDFPINSMAIFHCYVSLPEGMSWTWTGYEKTQKFMKHERLSKGFWGFVCLDMSGILISIFCDMHSLVPIGFSGHHIVGAPDFRPRSRMGCNCRRLATWSQSFPLRPEGVWWFLMVFDGFWWFLMVFDVFWWFLMVFDGFWLKNSTRMHHEDPWRSMKSVYRLKFLQDSCPTPGLHCIYVAGLRCVTYILVPWLVGGHETCLLRCSEYTWNMFVLFP